MRLDQALAARGLARSRSQAAALITAGHVDVNDKTVTKTSTPVEESDRIVVTTDAHYVSRAAEKLIAALDGFDIPVQGRLALDLGASTGGFTQVLVERGASRVIALDVGHDQMAPEIRANPAVLCVEGFNVRDLSPESLAAATDTAERPSLITADLSFISLDHVVGPIASVAAPTADIVLLIKPQFEVGRAGIGRGVVTDPTIHQKVITEVTAAARRVGLIRKDLIDSPLAGTHGNREFLMHLRAASSEEA